MTTGKAIGLGLGVGITAYLALIIGVSLFGVKLGELDKFPAYVRCLAEQEVPGAETPESCRRLRSYFSSRDAWRVERLAADSMAVVDRLKATARNDIDEIDSAWIAPIVRRLEMAAEVVKNIFAP